MSFKLANFVVTKEPRMQKSDNINNILEHVSLKFNQAQLDPSLSHQSSYIKIKRKKKDKQTNKQKNPWHLGRKAAKLKVVLLTKKKLFFFYRREGKRTETCCLFSSHA